jgi:hypothetical protein
VRQKLAAAHRAERAGTLGAEVLYRDEAAALFHGMTSAVAKRDVFVQPRRSSLYRLSATSSALYLSYAPHPQGRFYHAYNRSNPLSEAQQWAIRGSDSLLR